jgi:S1-C subfamily serine protease
MLRFARTRGAIALLAVGLAALALSCSGTADLIPGDVSAPTAASGEASPTPVIAPPILAPATVSPTGKQTRQNGTTEVIPDSELARSVVLIQLLNATTGIVRVVRDGSGVVIDADLRLILTSYTLVNPYLGDGSASFSSIAIGINRAAGEEPSLTFEAELVAADPLRDIAVLRAVRLFRGGSIGADDFTLPAATLGAPDDLERGDAVRILGHPGEASEGSQAVAATTASVSGFGGHELTGGRAWIRTDARMPYGITGGPAFDANGALIGIASQLRYDPNAVVAQIRPLTLADESITLARGAGPEARYRPPLERSAVPDAQPIAADGVTVAAPAFAQNAVESNGIFDLFDYSSQFPSGPSTIYYEYAAQRVNDGALVEERWFLDGIFQDSVSSSYTWTGGSFAVVTDRVVAPQARGLPAGLWVLEVWIDGTRRASSTSYIAVPLADEPVIDELAFGAKATATGAIATFPASFEPQLLALFDYSDARGATRLRWIVFRDGRVVYQSPPVLWRGGESGKWWIGYQTDGPIGAGFWEFEIYLDSPLQSQPISRGAKGISLP